VDRFIILPQIVFANQRSKFIMQRSCSDIASKQRQRQNFVLPFVEIQVNKWWYSIYLKTHQ